MHKTFLKVALALGVLVPALGWGKGLEWDIEGINGALEDNVRAFLSEQWVANDTLSSPYRRGRFIETSEALVEEALRPFGFYQPRIGSELIAEPGGGWRYALSIESGPAVRVTGLNVALLGEGAGEPLFREWHAAWPLAIGDVLRQPLWDEHKASLLDIATDNGYFSLTFVQQQIGIDAVANSADLALVVDTGPRARFGEVHFDQDFLREAVLTPIPRFEAGDVYTGWQVDQLRIDLWKLGLFEDIEVEELRHRDGEAPRVDLQVSLAPSHKATHQGTIGYGTDTEFRTQYRWQRHRLSDRGDTLTAGFAWQSRNQELLLFGEYRLPRLVSERQYWLLNPQYRRLNQDFELDAAGVEGSVPVGSGRVEDALVRFGRVKVRRSSESREQLIETMYLDYLLERSRFEELAAPFDTVGSLAESVLRRNRQSIAVGMDWDWPLVTGQGFDARGHRERAWVFTANKAWGSDLDFTQAYVSSRVNLRFADRWRLLLRGELGYTDADTRSEDFTVGETTFQVSLTELPERYRFRAGGSYSVRGYDFESLSNNGIGSNHLVTASIELEYRFLDDWSVAAFVDSGNAFNDWDDADLRTGYGLGVRWYTIGFPLRLDIAQAASLEGDPWQIHFTIGSALF